MSVELPDSYQAIYRQALEQMGVGESQEAIESLLRIVKRLGKLRPETLQSKPNLQQTLYGAWNAVTQFLRWEKRYQEAIDLTAATMDRLPDPASGAIRIASLTIESGQVEEGLAALTEIADERDDFAAWSALGTEFKILERYDDAIAAYRTALARATSNELAVVANLALFDLYRTVGQVEQALDTWKMILVLEPEMAEQEYQVYGWLIRHGYVEEAAPYLEREPAPIRRTFFEGLVEWRANREDAARRKWRQTLDLGLDDKDDEGTEDVDVEATMEAALRLGMPERVDELAQGYFLAGELLSIRAEVLRSIAKLMLGQADQARAGLEQALLRFRRGSRLQVGLAADLWGLLTELIPDPAQTAGLVRFFETGSR
jgi:tetratricopeptide (TPR) repeat protein